MSVATARAALVDTLRAIDGLEVYGYPQQNGNMPMAHVLCDTVDADFVLNDDTQRMQFLVRVFVGRADMEDSTAALDPFLDPSGTTVRGLINTDPTLGSRVDSARVMTVDTDRAWDLAGYTHVGAEFRIEVVG